MSAGSATIEPRASGIHLSVTSTPSSDLGACSYSWMRYMKETLRSTSSSTIDSTSSARAVLAKRTVAYPRLSSPMRADSTTPITSSML
jgi:hypothetical protein